jgi:hypothetical protein
MLIHYSSVSTVTDYELNDRSSILAEVDVILFVTFATVLGEPSPVSNGHWRLFSWNDADRLSPPRAEVKNARSFTFLLTMSS